MTRSDVPPDLQYQFERGTAEQENCKCGHTRSMHHPVQLLDASTALFCRGHHMSGGISGMVQQCGCYGYQPFSEWAAERSLILCAGDHACTAIVGAAGTLCTRCLSIARDAERDAHAEIGGAL